MFTVENLNEIENHPGPFAFEEELKLHKQFLIMGGWKLSELCGLYHEEKGLQACTIPIIPTAIYTNVETEREKIELKFWKFHKWHRIVVDREIICNVSKIISLSNYGVEVTNRNAKILSDTLNSIIQSSLHKFRYFTSVSHLGWYGEEFVPYSGMVVLDSESEYGALFNCLDDRGTLEEWKAYMAPLLKNIPLRMTLAASFASPLIELIGQNPFILHLWGKSGFGKTVAAMCAASVWGNPAHGKYLKSLNATGNAMLTMASVLKNLPLIADELQTIKCSGENFDKLIMTITEGSNRARMNRSKMDPTMSWHNCFIFNGEQPLTSSGSGGGAVNRCLQIEVNENLMPNGEETANFVLEHYGTAGREFINRLDPEFVKGLYGSTSNMLKKVAEQKGLESTSKQLAAMALLMTGDALMREFFFKDTIDFLYPEDVLPYLTSVKEVDVAERAFEYISNIISANSGNFSSEAREVWGTTSGDKVFINNTILERELNRGGFDFSAVKRSWVSSGYMLYNDKENKYRFKKSVWGTVTSCSCLIIPCGNNEIEDE